jgi:phage gp36-like protein
MSYATRADLEQQLRPTELIQLADDDGDGAADPSVIGRALADADAEINAYMGTRYALPLPSVPELIRRLAVDLALWQLYSRRDLATDTRTKQHDAAVALLKRLAEGTVSLGLPPTQQATPPPSIVSGERFFTRDKTEGF